MFIKLSHVGVAVRNLDQSLRLFSKLFNKECTSTEIVTDQKVKLAFIRIGDTSVELTEATSPDSAIAKFIEKRGEGVHHLSFEVDNIVDELRRLKAEGFHSIEEQPHKGAGGNLIAFLHPQSTGGILIELCQKMNRTSY